MAGVKGVLLLDLSHSFTSVAVSGGAILLVIDALFGHRNASKTQRYARLQDQPLRAATIAIGDRLVEALEAPHQVRRFQQSGSLHKDLVRTPISFTRAERRLIL